MDDVVNIYSFFSFILLLYIYQAAYVSSAHVTLRGTRKREIPYGTSI
jgi:hypothetical protein